MYPGSSQSDAFAFSGQSKFFFVPAQLCPTTIAVANPPGSPCASAPYLYASSQAFASDVTCASGATCSTSTNYAATNAVTPPLVSVPYGSSISTLPGLFVGVKSFYGSACTFQLNVSSTCTLQPGYYGGLSVAAGAYTYFYIPEQACTATFSVEPSGLTSFLDVTFSSSPFVSGTLNNAFRTSFSAQSSTGPQEVTITAAAFAHRDVADLFRGIYIAVYGISASTYSFIFNNPWCGSSCTYTTQTCYGSGCGACSLVFGNPVVCSRCLPGTSGSTLLPLALLTWSPSRTTCPASVYMGVNGCNPWSYMLVCIYVRFQGLQHTPVSSFRHFVFSMLL